VKDVYLICDAKNNTYKIGVSKNVDKRLKQLQTGNSNDLHLVYKIRTEHPFILESMLHKTIVQFLPRIFSSWEELHIFSLFY